MGVSDYKRIFRILSDLLPYLLTIFVLLQVGCSGSHRRPAPAPAQELYWGRASCTAPSSTARGPPRTLRLTFCVSACQDILWRHPHQEVPRCQQLHDPVRSRIFWWQRGVLPRLRYHRRTHACTRHCHQGQDFFEPACTVTVEFVL